MTTSLSLLFFLLLSLLSAASAADQTITKATGILSDSGYNSMSHYLSLAGHSLPSQPPSLTIFAPADAAFPYTGADHQPSPNLLRYHLLPVHFHLRSLRSLPFGAKISTLLHGYSLTVTTAAADDGLLSLNGVAVTPTPIFDDGSLIIYGTNRFFDPYFRVSGPVPTYGGRHDRCCLAPRNPKVTSSSSAAAAPYPFGEASKALRSRGYSVMASFLEMQLHGALTKLTVFAPVDRAMTDRIFDPSEYASVLRRHVAPCKICWNDLASLNEDGALLRTSLPGFVIHVSRHDGILTLNGGVTVIMPEIYRSDWLMVHGISEVLAILPESPPEPDAPAAVSHDPSAPDFEEFDSDDMEEFEDDSGQPEMFANMTEDDEAVSHRRFFVYRPV